MEPDSFENGMRISEAPVAEGDFYTEPHECMSCGVPATCAPNLIAHHRHQGHCYFTKQPSNQYELNQVVAAAHNSCVANVRYRGTDPQIIRAIGSSSCDAVRPPLSLISNAVHGWSRGFFKRLYHRK